MASPNYDHHALPAPLQQGQQQQDYSSSPLASQSQYSPPRRDTQPSPQPHQYHPQYEPQTKKQPSPRTNSRPKSRAFSFRSDKSQKAEKSAPTSGSYKITSADLHETSAEKAKKRLHSKADPTMAMNEAEPSAVAQSAANFDEHAPLRSIQHRDRNGNLIVEPDRSNPTRSRWERPLDTIRSFEAAIDGGYNRKSVYNAETDSVANWDRRSSYYGNNGPRFPQNSYYGDRPNSTFRPDSQIYDSRGSMMMGGAARDSYLDEYNNDGAYPNTGNGFRNNRLPPRNQSEPQLNARVPDKRVYPMPNNHRSYETVASGTGSGSYGEPMGYQTDPTSSENSSLNRQSPARRQEPMNDYGISFGQSTAAYQPPTFAVPASQPRTMPSTPPRLPRRILAVLCFVRAPSWFVWGSPRTDLSWARSERAGLLEDSARTLRLRCVTAALIISHATDLDHIFPRYPHLLDFFHVPFTTYHFLK
ncbi:uncharacterized protein BCR38DRAFT_174559 [Pseudomassariella vexata]|uniref:Uncharacterized protein n=1 Tax=Pseudomassariella vexata TaxID=1141098 RepID=A0A1Y2E424_9PEZI|nr:uncharacterized protein BCR38DRAFT_174559 [Pseudomassariella vexata]ORY66197.1 hypothetical protein BCR38DRAFT_174559 [Pseudomassariella vexata]